VYKLYDSHIFWVVDSLFLPRGTGVIGTGHCIHKMFILNYKQPPAAKQFCWNDAGKYSAVPIIAHLYSG
jgi:hypothetical protein